MNTSTVNDLCFLLVGFIYPEFVLSHHFLFAGLYFYDPKSPNYINSLLTTDKYGVVSYMMVLPEMAGFLLGWSSVYFLILFSISFQLCAKYWMKQISMSHIDTKTTQHLLREPKRVVFMYRQLDILTRMYNIALADIGQPLITLTISIMFVSCSFAAVRFSDRMHWFPYTMMPLTALVILLYNRIVYPSAAGIMTGSIDFRYSWEKDLAFRPSGYINVDLDAGLASSLIRVRAIESCRMVRIRMGKQYCVEKETLLIWINILVNQTIAVLVGVEA